MILLTLIIGFVGGGFICVKFLGHGLRDTALLTFGLCLGAFVMWLQSPADAPTPPTVTQSALEAQ